MTPSDIKIEKPNTENNLTCFVGPALFSVTDLEIDIMKPINGAESLIFRDQLRNDIRNLKKKN